LGKTERSLRSLFLSLERDLEYSREGVTLSSSRLAQGYVALERGYLHPRLFTNIKRRPKVSAGFALACDHSVSLNGGGWDEVCLLLGAIHSMADSLGVKSTSSIVHFAPDRELSGAGVSTHYVPQPKLFLAPSEPWKDAYLPRLIAYEPRGYTSLVCYAETAIDMALKLECQHKLAFFLTDGACGEKKYLESLRLQALAQGVHLVGIGLGVEGAGLPNGIDGFSAEEIAAKMVGSIKAIFS
jgi:hypothetical protein